MSETSPYLEADMAERWCPQARGDAVVMDVAKPITVGNLTGDSKELVRHLVVVGRADQPTPCITRKCAAWVHCGHGPKGAWGFCSLLHDAQLRLYLTGRV